MTERFDAYDDLFRSEGWRHFVADVEKEMQAMIQVVMTLNTTKDDWQQKAAKYINRYQAAKRMILNAQAGIKAEKKRMQAGHQDPQRMESRR